MATRRKYKLVRHNFSYAESLKKRYALVRNLEYASTGVKIVFVLCIIFLIGAAIFGLNLLLKACGLY